MALGQYFTIDALIAVTVLFAALALVASGNTAQADSVSDEVIAEDFIRGLSSITIENTTIPLLVELRSNGSIEEPQLGLSVLEYVAELWADNESALANAILTNASAPVQDIIGIAASINEDELYRNAPLETIRISKSSRLISGINKSQPVRGYSARMQFSISSNRTTSSLVYFGGFAGQGNLTAYLRDIPSDINATNVVDFWMEAAIEQDFEVFVNGQPCGSFSPSPTDMQSERFILSCPEELTPGENAIRLEFDDLDTAYVGGGFVKARYTTGEVILPPYGEREYHLPEIEGIINLYDSITIPGNLTSMEIHLEYGALVPENVTTTYYLTIGNTTVYNESNLTSESITLTDADLGALDYTQLSGTIPIRMGLEGVNYSGYITVKNPSDTVLVTDVSGSMDSCGDSLPPLSCSYGCTYQWYFWYFSTSKECSVSSEAECAGDVCGGSPTCVNTYDHDACRKRIDIAKEADRAAVDTILDSNVTNIGLVSYNDDVDSVVALTNDSAAIESEISSYSPGGGTCICCGIYRSYDLYSNFSENRSFMIMLSDGDATHTCSGPGDYTGSSASTSVSSNAAISAGQYACSNNVSVFTVALGEDLSSTGVDTLRDTACEPSMFYEASNISNLTAIYESITQEILSRTTFTSQIVQPGTGLASNLTNSSITVEFDPVSVAPTVNEVPITAQTPQLGSCNASFDLGPNLRVLEAEVTSYSDEHWTSLAGVNDETVFNISSYGADYQFIGDPFVIDLPADRIGPGVNEVALLTGDAPGNQTGCSVNNSIVMRAAVSVSPAVSTVMPSADGCRWQVLQEDLNYYNIDIPSDYNGTKTCYYENMTYDPDDAIDRAAYDLFTQLDVDDNGMIDLYLADQELSVEVTIQTDVPSLWGPSEFIVEVSR